MLHLSHQRVESALWLQQHHFYEAISEQQESLQLAVASCVFGFALSVYEQIITSRSFGILDDSSLAHCKMFVIPKVSNPQFYHSVQSFHTSAYSITLKHKSKKKSPFLLTMTKVANTLNASVQFRLL